VGYSAGGVSSGESGNDNVLYNENASKIIKIEVQIPLEIIAIL
jgi:hypothetical protein